MNDCKMIDEIRSCSLVNQLSVILDVANMEGLHAAADLIRERLLAK